MVPPACRWGRISFKEKISGFCSGRCTTPSPTPGSGYGPSQWTAFLSILPFLAFCGFLPSRCFSGSPDLSRTEWTFWLPRYTWLLVTAPVASVTEHLSAFDRVAWGTVRLLRIDSSNGRTMDRVAVTAAVFTTSCGKSGTMNPGNRLGCAPVINTGRPASLFFFLLSLSLCALASLSAHAGAPHAPPATGHAPETARAVPPCQSCRSAAASPPDDTTGHRFSLSLPG